MSLEDHRYLMLKPVGLHWLMDLLQLPKPYLMAATRYGVCYCRYVLLSCGSWPFASFLLRIPSNRWRNAWVCNNECSGEESYYAE